MRQSLLVFSLFFFFLLLSLSFTKASPLLTLYEPQNITYTTSYIPLNFTSNETVNFTIYVDGTSFGSNCREIVINSTYNETVCEMTDIQSYFNYIYTLNGSHYLNVTIYNENGSDSEEVYFTKNTGEKDVNVSSCGIITGSNTYVLINDIIEPDVRTCIDIQTSNVTLDCQNHVIRGRAWVGVYGIYSGAGNSNVTVQNCKVSGWGTGFVATGIFFYGTGYSSIKNTIVEENKRGLMFIDSGYLNITNVTIKGNGLGIWWMTSPYGIMRNSIIQDSSGLEDWTGRRYCGINSVSGGNTKFYNNIFNNTDNVCYGAGANYWNTTRQAGTRIYSAGTEIGGNYWTNPDGNGYSDTCADVDRDGFCDQPYDLFGDGSNVDYLPLSDEYVPPQPPRLYQLSPIAGILAYVLLPIVFALLAQKYLLGEVELTLQGLIKYLLIFVMIIIVAIGFAYVFSVL
jgi:hypothetical protein